MLTIQLKSDEFLQYDHSKDMDLAKKVLESVDRDGSVELELTLTDGEIQKHSITKESFYASSFYLAHLRPK